MLNFSKKFFCVKCEEQKAHTREHKHDEFPERLELKCQTCGFIQWMYPADHEFNDEAN